MERYADFAELNGKTFTAIHVGDDWMTFFCSDGSEYKMYHSQNCCESVSIEDICGDVNDLIGSPVELALESSGREWPVGVPPPDYDPESYTWTFYRLGTGKGTVVIRWYGHSNGYYSERVDLACTHEATTAH